MNPTRSKGGGNDDDMENENRLPSAPDRLLAADAVSGVLVGGRVAEDDAGNDAADHLAQDANLGQLHRGLEIFRQIHVRSLLPQHFADGGRERVRRRHYRGAGRLRLRAALLQASRDVVLHPADDADAADAGDHRAAVYPVQQFRLNGQLRSADSATLSGERRLSFSCSYSSFAAFRGIWTKRRRSTARRCTAFSPESSFPCSSRRS